MRINQLYHQAKWSLLTDEISCSLDDCLVFAALQVEYRSHFSPTRFTSPVSVTWLLIDFIFTGRSQMSETHDQQCNALHVVPKPPGKFLKILVFPPFFKGLESSGNQCRFWKVLEIWCQRSGMFLNFLCFKFDKFALCFVYVQLKNYGLLLMKWCMLDYRLSIQCHYMYIEVLGC